MAAITSKSALMMFYTEAETAGILRVSPRTLQRWRELGAGPAFTQARKGGRILYSDKAIEDYVASRTFHSISSADAEDAVNRNVIPAPAIIGGVAGSPLRRGRRRRGAIKMEGGAWDELHSSVDGVTLILRLDDLEPPSGSVWAICLSIPARPCCSRLYDEVRARIQHQGAGLGS